MERNITFELGGKEKSLPNQRDESRLFLNGDKLEVAVKNGRRLLSHLPQL